MKIGEKLEKSYSVQFDKWIAFESNPIQFIAECSLYEKDP